MTIVTVSQNKQTVTVLLQLSGANRCLSSIVLQIAKQSLRPLVLWPPLQYFDVLSGKSFSVLQFPKATIIWGVCLCVPVCVCLYTCTYVYISVYLASNTVDSTK